MTWNNVNGFADTFVPILLRRYFCADTFAPILLRKIKQRFCRILAIRDETVVALFKAFFKKYFISYLI